MEKTFESASCRPPSFHHILRIIVMMLLCMVCATPQSAAKTIRVKFPGSSVEGIVADTVITLTKQNFKPNSNSGKIGLPCTLEKGGLTFKFEAINEFSSQMKIPDNDLFDCTNIKVTITGVTFSRVKYYLNANSTLTMSGPNGLITITDSNPPQDINLSPPAETLSFNAKKACILDLVITTADPEPAITNYAVAVTQPSEGGKISLKNLDGSDVADLSSIPEGTKLNVVAQPQDGYEVEQIYAIKSGNKEDITTSKVFTVDSDTEITATFRKKTYPVTLSEYQNGSVAITYKNGTAISDLSKVESGSTLIVTLTPEDGCTAALSSNVEWSVKETTTNNGSPIRTYEVTVAEATVLTASFTKKKYAITIAEPTNGTFTVATASGEAITSNIEVEHGTELTITPTPANGYRTASVAVNGTKLSKNQDNRYTHIVTGPTTIAATFEADNENFTTLSFSRPQNGTLTVTSANSATSHNSGDRIPVGTQLTVTARPAQGYKLTGISAGQVSKSFDTTGEGTLGATTTSGTFNISATFEEYKTYAVTWTKPDAAQGTMTVKNDDVEITSGTKIENGKTLTVTLEANYGYAPSLKVNGTTAEATSTDNGGRAKTYTITVTASTTLTPEFNKNSYKVTIADSENGDISVKANDTELINGSSVEYGTELIITPKPSTGYKLSSLTISTGDNDVVLNSQPYTHTVKGHITIKATFVGDDVNYSKLSFSDSDGGKILVTSPYNNVIYKTGDRIAVNTPLLIKAIPNPGYKLTGITAGSRSKEFNTSKEDTVKCIATAGAFNITAAFAEYKSYAVTWTKPDATQGTMTVKNGDVEITSGTEIESGTTLSGTLRAAEGLTPSLKVNGNLIDAKSTADEGRTKSYDIIVNKTTTLTPLFTKNKYTVSITTSENGTVTVSTASGAAITGNSEVDHGTELIITPMPATGYRTASVSVNGKPLTVNQGKYSYAITKHATITAKFEVDNENYATLTVTRPENGTLTVTSNASTEPHKSGDLVKVGTKLTIKARPADGYRLKGITAGSITYPFDDTTEKTAEPNVTKGSYTISAQIEKIELHAVSWTNANPDGGTITVTHGTGTIASGTKIETGKEVTVTLTAKEGYTPSLESDVNGSVTETATASEGLVKIYKVTITKATLLTAKFIKKQPDKATVKYEPKGEGTVAFFSDAALTKPIDTTDGLNIEIGTTVYVKATPADSNYEAKVVYSTDGTSAQPLTPDSNGIFQFVAADAKATLSVSFVIKICDVTSRITCIDGDAAKAGTIEWKLSGSKTYDNPAKVECGKTINVRIKAADGYRIIAASGATIAADARITDIPFDLTVTKKTEITATFKVIPHVTINPDIRISGLATETQGKVKVTVAKSDGTPLSATDKVEDGTKLRIVASAEDNRYRFTNMNVGEYRATISENGATAVIDGYPVTSSTEKTSEQSITLAIDIVMARRTLAVTFTSHSTNSGVIVTSIDENGNRKSIASGTTVSVDTELFFQATPNAGYKIESMTVTPTVGPTLASTSADIDTKGICTLTARTPVSLENNAAVSYRIEITSRQKQEEQTYRTHYVTLAIADGQGDYGRVRFVDPKSEGMTVATDRKVTFEATPTDMPTDGRLGRYSFAGWSSNITLPDTERAAVEAESLNAVYSYGGDADAIFTASFTKNCQLTFDEAHTGGTMMIKGPDGALIESGDFVAPGTEITITVTATPSTGYRVNLITINGAVAYLFEDHPDTVTQTVTVEADMNLGCDIFVPSGIDDIDIDTDDKDLTWYTLNGIRLGAERPTQTGIYIVVGKKGRTKKVVITAD